MRFAEQRLLFLYAVVAFSPSTFSPFLPLILLRPSYLRLLPFLVVLVIVTVPPVVAAPSVLKFTVRVSFLFYKCIYSELKLNQTTFQMSGNALNAPENRQTQKKKQRKIMS